MWQSLVKEASREVAAARALAEAERRVLAEQLEEALAHIEHLEKAWTIPPAPRTSGAKFR